MPLDQSIQVLAAAVVTFVVLQAAKKVTPGLCGKHAVGLNLALTTVSTLVATRPATWAEAISMIVASSAAAAGLHGTLRSLRGPACDAAAEPAPPGTVSLLVVLLAGMAMLTGCAHRTAGAPAAAVALPVGAVDATDAASNRALQTAHAFASRITVDVASGKLALSSPQRTAMGRMNAVLNIADKYEQDYHDCGVARAGNTTLPTCDTAKLTAEIALVQELFADAEMALTPSTK